MPLRTAKLKKRFTSQQPQGRRKKALFTDFFSNDKIQKGKERKLSTIPDEGETKQRATGKKKEPGRGLVFIPLFFVVHPQKTLTPNQEGRAVIRKREKRLIRERGAQITRVVPLFERLDLQKAPPSWMGLDPKKTRGNPRRMKNGVLRKKTLRKDLPVEIIGKADQGGGNGEKPLSGRRWEEVQSRKKKRTTRCRGKEIVTD